MTLTRLVTRIICDRGECCLVPNVASALCFNVCLTGFDVFRFLHAADLHLDSPLKGLERYEGAPVDEMRGATRRALENLVELAIDREVDFVLIAGDVYDGDWKDHNTGLFFTSQMVKLKEAGIPVVMISGNHDAANRMTKSLRLPDNVDLLPHGEAGQSELKTLHDLGVAVYGRSFARQAEFENFALSYPDRIPGLFNIGLLHTSLTGFDGHEPYAPCTPENLIQKQYDYWALGHVHNRSVISGESTIVFPGNLQGRHIRESEAKGCYLVHVDGQLKPSLEFQPLDVVRWVLCDVDAGKATQMDDVLAELTAGLIQAGDKQGGLPLAVRVCVTASPAVYREFQSSVTGWTSQLRATAMEATGGAAWIEKVHFQPAVPGGLLRDSTLDGPIGELKQYLAQLHADDAELTALGDHFSDLAAKLPGELTRGEFGQSFKDPQQMRKWLEEVEALLLNRLTQGPNP